MAVSMDPITETIAHFIGFFEIAVEEARGRLDYDEFRALKAKMDDAAGLYSMGYANDASYILTDAEPDLHYIPFEQTVVPMTAANRVNSHYTPPESVDIGLSAPDPYLRFDGYLFPMRLKTEYILTPPGSTAAVIQQTNHLHDNDFLSMTGEDVDTDIAPAAFFDAGLDTLAGQADALDPVGDLDKPVSEEAIGTLVQDIAWLVENSPGEDPGDAGPAEIHIAKGSAAVGIHVNGATVDEAPALSEYLPEEESDSDEVEPVTFMEGDGEIEIPAHVTLDTGSNLLVNEALLANNWVLSPVIAVAGDAIDINLISQINVWCDTDSIGAEFASWVSADASPTTSFNIASVTKEAATPDGEGTGTPDAFPTHWTVTRLEGNLVFLDWIEQLNFVSDHDATIMTKVGSQTMIQTGGNASINFVSLMELGTKFDLIVAGGGYFHANIINQMNVLLDNDFMWAENGFQSSGEGALSTGGNLLWNQASIHTVGQTKFMGLPDHYMQAADSLGGGSDHLSASVLSDAAFAGLGSLNVLYLGGSIFDFQYISQKNILGDSDQIAMYEDSLACGMDNGWTVTTGSNNLVNIASIVDSGLDGTVYAGGEIYSDALLYQAELISDDPLATPGNPSELASEAVVFLADGMLDPEIDDDGGAIAPDQPDAVHVDVMQTMLA
ncbi:MAG: type I secretion protein [Oricola sp.]